MWISQCTKPKTERKQSVYTSVILVELGAITIVSLRCNCNENASLQADIRLLARHPVSQCNLSTQQT